MKISTLSLSLSFFSLWAVGKQKSLLLSLKHSETVTQVRVYRQWIGVEWCAQQQQQPGEEYAEEGETENDEPLFRYLSVSLLPLSLYKRMYLS